MVPLIKHMLFATDFSACADRAMGYALSLAGAWKANLCVVTVLELYPGMDPDYTVNKMYLDHLREEANRQLGAVQARAKAASQSVTTRIEVGIPSQALQTVAESTGADLLVVGTHGRTGLDHVLVGSTAERVVRVSPCPVLAVKADKGVADSSAAAPIKRIVVPVDLSTCSLDALEYAVQFAKPLGAAITILHAMEPVAYGLDFSLSHAKEWKEQRDYLEKRLSVLSACVTAHGIQADHVLKPGLPADSIVSHVTQQGFDLMIMGTHGRRGISHVLLGSIAGAMLRHAPCPVLTVRQVNFGADYERVVPLGNS
ncbi:MAG: universal stress protein [Nitrospira sp.]|nr:universal stress protein [Nitrospira sp.]HMW86322.1 universal stress protein [Nitrospira sp.]HMX92366.1 universal stress protein [Nitrospira sp.]HNA48352.1 universal stress protein [Nitrospira sp.]HNA87152.1 universal stress protein [Nitrospira sp.]